MKLLFPYHFFSLFNSGIKIDSDSENESEDDFSIRNHLQGLVDKIIHLKRRMSGLPEDIMNEPGQKQNQSLLGFILYTVIALCCELC